MVQLLVVPILLLIYGLPLVLAALPVLLRPTTPVIVATLLAAPLVYSFFFALTAGLLSTPFHKAIIPGKFPRDLRHPIYGRRRLYGLCWTALYYFKPVYYLCLTIPALKWLTFRLFGYRGSMDFTVYPDTWIRDLPLLDFGAGSYIANRATIGTNMALSNGTILVDTVTTGKGAMVGHLSMMAPGSVLGDHAEVGVNARIGIRVKIDAHSLVNTDCAINHHSSVGSNTVIDSCSISGLGAVIGSGLNLPFGAVVPARAKILTKEDVEALLSAKNSSMPKLRKALEQIPE